MGGYLHARQISGRGRVASKGHRPVRRGANASRSLEGRPAASRWGRGRTGNHAGRGLQKAGEDAETRRGRSGLPGSWALAAGGRPAGPAAKTSHRRCAGGPPPPRGTTGLYHLAVLYPTRAELADALRRLIAAGIELEGAADHGVSEALYLRDPDGNGVELYWDLPQEQWPRTADGELAMYTRGLDVEGLLASGR